MLEQTLFKYKNMKKIILLLNILFLSVIFVSAQEKQGDTIKGPPLPCIAPTTQASSFTATATSSSTIDLTWVRGDGDNVLILAHSGAVVDSDPISGNSYTANAAFGSGTQIGTGNYVVYKNNGTSVTVTGLTAGVTYYFAIYEFYNTDICYMTPGAVDNATTSTATPVINSVTGGDFFKDKGRQITINGTDLSGATNVSIAGINATIDSNTATVITATFPAGVYSNNTLSVTTPGGTDTYAVSLQTRNVIPVGGGTDPHTTIQSALDGLSAWYTTDAFNAGQLPGVKTIDVYNGTYTEKVTPNVTLGTTASENLIIQNHIGEAPVVDASGLSNAFYVGALDFVQIIGFTAHSSTSDVIYTEGDNNIIKYNQVYGSTAGSGILLSSAATTTVVNNLVYNNNQFGIRIISSNNAVVDNNTVANNGNEAKGPPLPGLYEPAQLYVESGTGISVENNIFYAKSGTAVFTLKTDAGSGVTSDYNTYYKNGNNFLVNYQGTVYVDLAGWSGNGAGANDLETDPDFVNAGTDWHIKSTFGSYPYPAQWPPEASASAWNNDASDSPALDTGNPADAFANEPAAGGRINQGAYGNTAQASKSVACVYPTTQATNFSATPDITTADISWTRGNGDFVIILAHEGAAVDANPVDGTTYTANAAFGSGTQIGTGNYVVYIGTLTTETVTALTSNTTYHFALYEFSDANKCYKVPALTGNTTTLDCAPTTQATAMTGTPAINSINLGWTRGNGDNVIVLAHEAAAVDSDPVSGTTYTADANFSGAPQQIGVGNYVVYTGNGTSVNVTGLTAGTVYHFAVYEYNDAGMCYLIPALTGNYTTLVASPSITNVNPNNFFADKGKQITITGSNLGDMTAGTTVTIAGVTGTKVSNDGSTLVVDFPAGLYINNTLTVATGIGTDATSTVTVNTRNTIPVGGGTDPHTTIQSALDGLSAWFTTSAFNTSTAGYLAGTKTIDVYNGTYTEKVTPNVNLGTTAAENLIIQNHIGEAPVVDASGLSNAFYVGALDYVQIIGFTAHSSTSDVIYTEGDNNIIQYNKVYGSTGSSGILLNSAATTTVINNLIYNNNQFGVRLITSNNAVVKNNTIANNGTEAKGPPLPSIYTPAQLYVESGTGVSVKNNIIYSKSGTNIFTLLTEPTITVTSDYNTYFKNGNTNLVYYNGSVYADLAAWTGNGAGANEVETDPDFVTAGTDWHIHSAAGSYAGGNWPPVAATGGAWVLDGTTSTALDAGDPADAFANEPQSGNNINQGAYGNTAQASKSPSSFVWVGGDGSGAQQTDWNRGGNWSGGVVPTSSDNAIIPDVTAASNKYPIIDFATAQCKNLNISDNAEVTLVTGGALAVSNDLNLGNGVSGAFYMTAGDLNVSGTFTAYTGSNLKITAGNVTFLSQIFNANSIVTYDGNNQTLKDWAYQDVILNGTGTMLIPGTLAAPTTCDDFTINNTGNVLNIPEGKALTVNGTLTNNVPGNTGLVVKSSTSGDGSLIFNNTGVNGIVERYLAKVNAEAGQWHFLGSPVTAAPISLFNTNNFYQYNEDADDWWTGATYFYNTTSGWQVPAGNLTVGKGYIYYFTEATLNFEGEINYNAGGYPVAATYTTHAGNAGNGIAYTNFDGWNFISNPYPSALDWTAMNLSDINNTVYFYDDATDNYKYYTVAGPTYVGGITVNGGSQFIPKGQGFFIKTDNAAGGTFTIPNASRVHNLTPFWKESKLTSPENIIRLQVNAGNFNDETVMYQSNDATSEFDGDYDAYKRFSWNDAVPQIYSVNSSLQTQFAINAQPINENTVIPLGYYFKNSGEHTINVTNINFTGYTVYLLDKLTGNEVDLKKNNSYTFTTESGVIENRLEIHFKKNTSGVENASITQINVFPNPAKNELLVSIPDNNNYYEIIITNISGQTVYNNNFFGSKIKRINIQKLNPGVYLLNVKSEGINVIKKIIIE